jgi:uncharacterized membrane protein
MIKSNKKFINTFLIVSLSLNLFLGGIVIGNLVFGKPNRPFPPHLNWITERLNEDDRREIRPLMREHAMNTRPLRKAMRESQKNFVSALMAEPFDEAAVTKATEELQSHSANLQSNMHKQMIKLMRNMTPLQRKNAINQLENRRAPKQRRER